MARLNKVTQNRKERCEARGIPFVSSVSIPTFDPDVGEWTTVSAKMDEVPSEATIEAVTEALEQNAYDIAVNRPMAAVDGRKKAQLLKQRTEYSREELADIFAEDFPDRATKAPKGKRVNPQIRNEVEA